jgi:hypothetical protein
VGEKLSTNLELARRTYDLWNAAGVDAVVERLWAPHVVFHDAPEVPDADVFRGVEAVGSRIRAIMESLGPMRQRVRSLEERDDYTLAALELTFKGASSGVQATTPLFQIIRWEDGLVREFWNYTDGDEARRDFEHLSAQSA